MSKPAKPRILLLSAYDAGSHKRWREQLVAGLPDYDWQWLSLPPRFFRWRIRGNALSWLNDPLLHQSWDLLVVSSMVDLATIRGFHRHLCNTPCLLYMHENQFAYPESASQYSSAEPKMVNLCSAVAADRILFNSEWNRQSFLQGVEAFLQKMPDAVPQGLPAMLQEKSAVLPVPIEDRLFKVRHDPVSQTCPHLVWNHRWEYDKAPERLLKLLHALKAAGQDFRLSVVGERFRQQPEAFGRIKTQFGRHIVNFGYLPDAGDYHRLLAQADIVISTALHDFQGLAMLEAMASGCLALAPDRLAYPEYVPAAGLYASYPDDENAEAQAAAECLQSLLAIKPGAKQPDDYRFSRLIKQYQQALDKLIQG